MGLPAQYRVDAEPVYIDPSDTCWDHDKINAERAELPDGEFHAMDRWWAGISRYDPRAMPEGYMIEGEQPVRWHMRRLHYAEWSHVKGLKDSETLLANYEAVRLGVTRVEGCRIDDVVWPGTDRRKRLTQSDVETILKVVPRHMVESVGEAVIRANRDLTPIEKKA